jgi:hypothetical protein
MGVLRCPTADLGAATAGYNRANARHAGPASREAWRGGGSSGWRYHCTVPTAAAADGWSPCACCGCDTPTAAALPVYLGVASADYGTARGGQAGTAATGMWGGWGPSCSGNIAASILGAAILNH